MRCHIFVSPLNGAVGIDFNFMLCHVCLFYFSIYLFIFYIKTIKRMMLVKRKLKTYCIEFIVIIVLLKVSFTEKPFNSSSFRNTIAHSKLHMHAARENDLLPPLPALANERKYTEKQADQKEPFFVT